MCLKAMAMRLGREGETVSELWKLSVVVRRAHEADPAAITS